MARNHAPFPTYRVTAPLARRPNRPKISAAKRRRVYERDLYRCQSCGLDFTGCIDPRFPHHAPYRDGVVLEIDHIIPVSSGLVDHGDETNMQALCQPCNGRKAAHQ